MPKHKPERERSNILRFQPPVTKAEGAGCPARAPGNNGADPLALEGLRLFKAFFAIEDAAMRASLIELMDNISGRKRSGRKRDGR